MKNKNNVFGSEDDVLNNPGIFAFQIEEDGSYKHSKMVYPFYDNVIKGIHQSILECFSKIATNLNNYVMQSPLYLGQICGKLIKYVNNRNFRFPGLQVVNMNREMLDFFSQVSHRFLICEKSDGVRYLLLHFFNGVSLFVGRNLEFFRVSFTEHFSNDKGNENDWRLANLLDGELILDKCKDDEHKSNIVFIEEEKRAAKFLVFDAIIIEGQNIGHFPFKDRLARLSKLFKNVEFGKYSQNITRKYINKFKSDIAHSFLSEENLISDISIKETTNNNNTRFSIELYMKDYFTLCQVELLYPRIATRLPHHNDGIIINTDDYPYYSGQACEIFKWKPSNLTTIDFEIVKNGNGLLEMQIKNGNYNTPVSCLFFKQGTDDEERFQKDANPSGVNIAECYFDKTFVCKDTITLNYNVYMAYRTTTTSNITNVLENYNSSAYYSMSEEMKKAMSTGGWRFMRFRKDKLTANAIHTYQNILQSLEEDLRVEEIIKKVKENKRDSVPELDDAKGCISAAVWEKFYKRKENNVPKVEEVEAEQVEDIDDDYDLGDDLVMDAPKKEKTLKKKRERKHEATDKKKPVQFNVQQKVEEKVPVMTKAAMRREMQEQKKKERKANFSETLNLLSGGNQVHSNAKTKEEDKNEISLSSESDDL